MEEKLAIKRGCQNKQCFCTGKCNEIIGYNKSILEQMIPLQNKYSKQLMKIDEMLHKQKS